jgi:hypothetical protein
VTSNEIRILAHSRWRRIPEREEIDLALAVAFEERRRIIAEIQRSARGVDAGVSKPDLWALAKLIEDML